MEKVSLIRTNSENPDFIKLVRELDTYLAICDGEEHEFYDQYNKLDRIRNVVLVYFNNEPAGCGAFKKYSEDLVEIKRMFVAPNYRKKGLASKILQELEKWAGEEGFQSCILETGKRMTEAVSFYRQMNYLPIEKYPPYENVENSLCFSKNLN